jgi:putative glutathione S-transferase
MGLLVKGEWQDKWYDTSKSGGEFIREDAQYRHWITLDGQASELSQQYGDDNTITFKAESGRYHLYVSLACPWAHRTLIFRELKGLKKHISVSVVHPHMLTQGWTFETDAAALGDDLYNSQYAYEIYTRDKADYSGRVTVPILWDKKQQCIVSNESSEIIRMFNSAFNHLTNNDDDYYPKQDRLVIDEINSLVYECVNNGVYRTGFTTTQAAYEKAFNSLFNALDELDERLAQQRYLVGEKITEADWRLFTTLVRFDAVYAGHFKCNLKRIADYQHLSGYLRELYQYPGVAETVNFEHIKQHYYYSHDTINPTRVVPLGPKLDLEAAHMRG